jgi:hypothetical protein
LLHGANICLRRNRVTVVLLREGGETGFGGGK